MSTSCKVFVENPHEAVILGKGVLVARIYIISLGEVIERLHTPTDNLIFSTKRFHGCS